MSSKNAKLDFMKKVTILIDTREQKNDHITAFFQKYGVQFESRKLDYGDYSFIIDGKDFSHSSVIERKANVNEVYGNITADRERIKKELDTISRNAVQCVFLLENCASWEALKATELTDAELQATGREYKQIGATCYSTLMSWRCGNRYDFTVEFVENNAISASKILEIFFWYYHNYKEQTAPRK